VTRSKTLSKNKMENDIEKWVPKVGELILASDNGTSWGRAKFLSTIDHPKAKYIVCKREVDVDFIAENSFKAITANYIKQIEPEKPMSFDDAMDLVNKGANMFEGEGSEQILKDEFVARLKKRLQKKGGDVEQTASGIAVGIMGGHLTPSEVAHEIMEVAKEMGFPKAPFK
jgi:hypothetical protein